MRRLLVLLLAFVNVGLASSQTPDKKADSSHRQADSNQRATHQAPLVVHVVGSDTGEAAARRKADNEAISISSEQGVWHWTKVLAIVTAILALATIILMVFTGRLWLSTNAMAGDAKTSSERGLRAYVTLGRVKWKCDKGSTDRIAAKLNFKNSGKTPAYNVRYSPILEFCDTNKTAQPAFPVPVSKEGGMGILGPAEARKWGVFGAVVTPEQWEAITKRPQHCSVQLRGTVWYDDAFGVERYTNFLLERVWIGGVVHTVMKSYGNDAT